MNRTKRQPTDGEIVANHIPDEGLMANTYLRNSHNPIAGEKKMGRWLE